MQVRWALDLARVKYTEDAHAPGFHAFETLPATSGRWSATPVLVLRDGTATWDSTEILKRLAIMYSQQLGTLYPPGMGAEVEALEEYLDDVLGPNARQVCCRASATLHHPALTAACAVAILFHAP